MDDDIRSLRVGDEIILVGTPGTCSAPGHLMSRESRAFVERAIERSLRLRISGFTPDGDPIATITLHPPATRWAEESHDWVLTAEDVWQRAAP